MALATYVADEVIATIGGHIIGGWQNGSRINITQVTATWMVHEGTDLISRGLVYTGMFKVNFTLQQTSGSNDVLTAIHDFDVQTRAGHVKLSVTDIFGTSKMMSPNAFIEKLPDQAKAVEVGTVEWSVFCPDVEGIVVGGNVTV